MTEIKHHNDGKKGLFEIYFENKKAGEMTSHGRKKFRPFFMTKF